MGGGGGGGFGFQLPGGAEYLRQQAIEDGQIAEFQSRLGGLLTGLLAAFNNRDHRLVAERLEDIQAALEAKHEGPFTRLFGGSVAKHTYVDGLSDIDCLVNLNDSELRGHTPDAALERIAEAVDAAVVSATVKVGRMAVTVRYDDGMELQLLPAVDLGGGRLQVPSAGGEGWSRINPRTFRAVLSQRNEECGQKLVPTIKLAKAVLAAQHEGLLSGYHVESLAISAFRDYAGTKTTAAMLPAFFERARTLVLDPIRDSTGQSIHVDAELGPSNSQARQRASLALGRIARQMRTASAVGSEERWREFFGYDE